MWDGLCVPVGWSWGLEGGLLSMGWSLHLGRSALGRGWWHRAEELVGKEEMEGGW